MEEKEDKWSYGCLMTFQDYRMQGLFMSDSEGSIAFQVRLKRVSRGFYPTSLNGRKKVFGVTQNKLTFSFGAENHHTS